MSIERLSRLLAGADERAWICDALKLWLSAAGDLPLERCLRLPCRPAGLRRMLRDLALAEAAACLPPAAPWTRARWLAAAIQRFETRLWPCWRSMNEPPGYATPIERALFRARLYGELPASQRALYRRLTEKVPPASATESYRDTIVSERKQRHEPAIAAVRDRPSD